jgi:hypothetical protein
MPIGSVRAKLAFSRRAARGCRPRPARPGPAVGVDEQPLATRLRADQGHPLLLPEDQERLAQGLGQRRVRGDDQRLSAARDRPSRAGIEDVPVTAVPDLHPLAQAPGDRERAVPQADHPEEVLARAADQQAPTLAPRRRPQSPGAALAEVEQGTADAPGAQPRQHAIEGVALRDAAEVHGRAGPRQLDAAVFVDAQRLRADAATRPREIRGPGQRAAGGGGGPQREQRTHGHVEAPARQARVGDGSAQDLRDLRIDRLGTAPGAAVEAAHIAPGVVDREQTVQPRREREELVERLAQSRLVGTDQRDLEDGPHHVAAVAHRRERRGLRRRAAPGERGRQPRERDAEDQGPPASSAPSGGSPLPA